MTSLVILLGLVALVLLISALASGMIERAPLSFPIIFLGLGLLLGVSGSVTLLATDPLLEGVAAISLSLALFLDATKLRLDELRRDWFIPFLTLGPGTLLTIGGITLAALWVLGVEPLPALLLGAALASTDSIVLRDVLRDPRLPRSVRRALSVEAGMNDIVVLPVVLTVVAFLNGRIGGVGDILTFVALILILSPIVGLLVGMGSGTLMRLADARFPVRREFQALYGIGIVLAAYTAGQAVGGSGFVSAFFAGLALTFGNRSLCDCFLEYGETTGEMLMLLAFVLFGVVLSGLFSTLNVLPVVLLALLLIFVIRPLSTTLVLLRAHMSGAARLFVGWFGPRGLSSLLLALLAVQAAVPGAEGVLAITGGVVVVSVLLHGVTATPGTRWYAAKVAAETLAEERESTFSGLFDQEDPVRQVSAAELRSLMQSSTPPVLLDVRSRSAYAHDSGQIPGSVRVLPDQVIDWAEGQSPARWVIAYCTCPDEATSLAVAHELKRLGFSVGVLIGGYRAWEAEGYPLAPKSSQLLPGEVIDIQGMSGGR